MANLSVNTTNNNNGRRDEKSNGFYSPSPSPGVQSQTPQAGPPPAYPTAPATPATALTTATALYAYTPTDAGDLALNPQDRIAVTEYMNAEWWKGRSERTGQEGIFPRSYVRVEEKLPPAPTNPGTNYGNVPLDVSQSGGGPVQGPGGVQPGKGAEYGKRFGKKLGNAAIFGAGATIGSEIVHG